MFLDDKFLYKKLFFEENNREINLYKLFDVNLTGQNLFYPNCVIYKSGETINPVNEKIMSLESVFNNNNVIANNNVITNKIIITPVFYFIYNTDNYYHFIYDTLPYLISYRSLKKEIPDIKLLMNYPNESCNSFYPFVLEFLDLLGIKNEDIIIADNETKYSQIFVSSSYTHGVDSNLPPRKEVYDLYNEIVDTVNKTTTTVKEHPKKIYVSRRTWVHNDFSNIGTNYTNRRKLKNEDLLVQKLVDLGYVEVFTEKLSTLEKIKLFSEVDIVVGSIGGGMCNVLFSKPKTKVIPIISPTFLDVNKRFIYSFSKVDLSFFNETRHVSDEVFKKYMRVKSNGIVGEIVDVLDDHLIISYSKNFVAGWNSETVYELIKLKKKECTPLDGGLNSEWEVNIDNLIKNIY